MKADKSLEHLKNISDKCEQYWNESNISDAELHAMLEYIYREANAVRIIIGVNSCITKS